MDCVLLMPSAVVFVEGKRTGEMNNQLLNRLLARDEGQFLEFKSAYKQLDGVRLKRHKAAEVARDVAETLCVYQSTKSARKTRSNSE